MTTIPLTLLTGALLLVPGAFAKTRVLLVAVDNYQSNQIPDLNGCVNDLRRFQSVLTRDCGVPVEAILTLTDEKASQRQIEAAFQNHLIEGVEASDTVLFYFSGHGTQHDDMKGDEADGLDEALCAYDFEQSKPQTWFTDDMIGKLLRQVPTQDILVILDSCYSGTATRAPEEAGKPEISMTRGINLRPRSKLGSKLDGVETGSACITLAAAQASQEANEVYPFHFEKLGILETETRGLFTYLFCNALSEKPEATFRELRDKVIPESEAFSKKLLDINPGASVQKPLWEIPSAFLSRPFADFARDGSSPSTPPPVKPNEPRPPLTSLLATGADPKNVEISSEGTVSSGQIRLQLGVNRAFFHEGDTMVVTLSANQDCFVRLYYKSADGSTAQIFPNAGRQDNHLTANQTIRLPSPGDRFRFTVKPPFGSETILAVASSEQFQDIPGQDWSQGFFSAIPGLNLAAAGSRGLSVDVDLPERVFGHAWRVHEVFPKASIPAK